MINLAEIKIELAKLGYKVVKIPTKKPYKFKTPGFKWYNGIAAKDCKGFTLIYQGALPTFAWPSDLARFYDGTMPWQEKAARIHYAMSNYLAAKGY